MWNVPQIFNAWSKGDIFGAGRYLSKGCVDVNEEYDYWYCTDYAIWLENQHDSWLFMIIIVVGVDDVYDHVSWDLSRGSS